MNEPCRFHPNLQKAIEELVGKASSQEAYGKIHHDQITAIQSKLDAVKEAADKNYVRAEQRDLRLGEIKDNVRLLTDSVQKVQRTVENGINEKVEILTKQVKLLTETMEERKRRRVIDLAEYSGVNRLIKIAYLSIEDTFRKYIGPLFFLFLIWIVWVVSKTEIFDEKPVGLIKILLGQ